MGAYGQGKIGYADANHRLGESFESGGVTTIFVNVQRLFSPAELLAFTRNTVRAAFIWACLRILRLKTVAHARLGDDVARPRGVGFQLLAQLRNEDAQVLAVLVVLGPAQGA